MQRRVTDLTPYPASILRMVSGHTQAKAAIVVREIPKRLMSSDVPIGTFSYTIFWLNQTNFA